MASPLAFGPAPASVNFFQQAPETATDLNALQRQRLMAELLAKKGQETPEGQMVSGHYVAPGAGSYISQLVSALGGGMMSRDADAKEQSLAQALIAKRQKDASDFMGAINGSPAQAARDIQPLTPNDDEGNPMPVAQVPATAAVPGDMNKALAIALQSQNPMLAGMAPDIMKRQMDAQEFNAALQAAQGGGSPGGGSPAGAPAGGAPGNTMGLNTQAYPFLASPNSRAQAFGKAIQEANKPQTVAPGGSLMNSNGTLIAQAPMAEPGIQVMNVPGGGQSAGPVANYAEVKAAQEAAIARAKEDQQLKTINVNGVDVTKTVGQWREQMGGGTPGSPTPRPPGAVGNGSGPVNGQRPANPMAPRPEDSDRPLIYAAERKNLQDNLLQAQATKDPTQIARAQADVDALEKEIRSNRINLPAPQGIQGQSAADAKYQTTRAEDYAKRASAIQSAAGSSGGMLRNLDALEQLFKDPNVAKGGAAEGISGLKNAAASLGVDIKGVGAEQAIQAITNKMALDARSTADGGGMPGAMSDSDRGFLKALQPGLEKTPEGRALIIANNRKIAERNIEVARMAQRYEQVHGKLDAGFDRELQAFADANPMFKNSKAPAALQSPDIRSLAAQELARRQKGGN